MQEINMPDVGKGADLGHIYTWLYNGGSYGRKPSIGDMLDMGWGPLLAMGLVYYDTTNKDVRYRWDGSGRAPTVDQYSYEKYAEALINNYFQPVIKTRVNGSNFQHKYYSIPFALGGGVQPNLSLLAAVASYFGVIRLIGVISTSTIAAFDMAFECPAGSAALPGGTFRLALVENILNTTLQGIVITGAGADPANDNDAIVVDLSGGAGAETGYILFEGWYES